MSASNPTHHHAHAPSSTNAPHTQHDAYPHDSAFNPPPYDFNFPPPIVDDHDSKSRLPPTNLLYDTSPLNRNTNGHHRNSIGSRPRADSNNGNTMGPGATGVSNGHGPIPVPMPMPMPMPMPGSNGARMSNGGRPTEGPRSPPNSKNTSHVPCKFYKQGQCQAGAACPFRHSDTADICKYFQKGNCKFGMRCANEHITGDGKRVNKSAMLNGQGPGMISGPRAVPMAGYMGMPQDPYTMPPMLGGAGMLPHSDDFNGPNSWRNATSMDMANLGSHPGSMFGSPPGDGRLPLSPIQKGLSVMDVPLPASFDSQGISHFAQAGPFAASVPTRFGLETSPPSSIPRVVGGSNVLRNLRNSAFGGDDGLDKTSLASSPPISSGIEFSNRRLPLHSERFTSKPNALSMSLGTRAAPRTTDDWDASFGYEEDMVPNSLTDLLTPQEKMRRLSRSNVDDDSRLSQHLIGLGSEPSSKVGSPSLGVSPSRYSGIFARQKSDNNIVNPSESIGNSAIMNFGHVGSPLRNSYLSDHLSNERDGFLNSPHRQASMSMISQQLQRTKLQSRAASEETLTIGGGQPSHHSGTTRTMSATTASMTSPSLTTASTTKSLPIPGNRFDRTISSSSMARSDKIDEELMDSTGELFAMDDPEDEPATTAGALSGEARRPHPFKRDSGGRWAIGKASPRLGPIGGQRASSSSGSLLGGLSSSLGKGDRSPWNS